MARKLALILKKIHWSSAFKAAIFGISWMVFPYWVPVIVGLYFYLFTAFLVFEMAVPFLIIIFLSLMSGKSVLFAVFLSLAFYLTLALKDMHFIKKEFPREILAFLLLVPIFMRFFSYLSGWNNVATIFLSVLVSSVVFFLIKWILVGRLGPINSNQSFSGLEGREVLVSVFVAVLVWQLALVLIFMPLNFIYQSAILIVFVAVVFGVAIDYFNGVKAGRNTLFNLSTFLVFVAIILGSAQWGL